jgi:integrase
LRLTDLAIRKLPHSRTQKIYFDDSLGGFGVRCSKKTKSFVVKYGKERSFKTIGRFPDKSLSEARKEAKRILATHSSHLTTSSYEDALLSFLEDCEDRNRPSTVKGYRHYLGVYDCKKRVSDITRKDIQDHLKRYSEKPSGYSHALTAFKIFFNWCLRQELAEKNPIAGERSISILSRDRVLTTEEIIEVWAYEYPHFSTIIKLCFLTGQRRSEVAGIELEWIKDGVLTFPATFTKNKRRHSIPVSEQVLKLLEGAPFGQDSKPWNGWSNGKRRIDKYVEMAHWTLHDLRRTFSTIHAEIGTPIHITERLLNHASGSTGGIVGIYNKYQYMDEMHEAQEKYEKVLMNIVNS